MKRLTWILAALFVTAAALPALAGGKGEKCSQDAQTCLNHFTAKKDKGWTGIEIDKVEAGQVIKKIVPGGPAEKAGLQVGDVLMTRNGIKLSDYEALKADKDSWKIGANVTYVLLRNDKEKKVAVTLGPLPEEVFAAMVGAHMVSDHMQAASMAAETDEAKSAKTTEKAVEAKSASSDK